MRRAEKHFEVLRRNPRSIYQQHLMNIENGHSRELLAFFDMHNTQKVDWGRNIENIATSKKNIIGRHEHELANNKQKLIDKLIDRKHMTQTFQNELDSLRLELIERKDEVEDDIDTHLQVQKTQNGQILLAERQSTLKVAGENGIIYKRTKVLMQSIEDQKDAIKHLLYK